MKWMLLVLSGMLLASSVRAAGLEGVVSAEEGAIRGAWRQAESARTSAAAFKESPQEMLDRALREAIGRFDIEEVRRLVKMGANPNADDGVNSLPLSYAAMSADMPEMIDALVELGANVEGKGVCDYTALHSAAESGHLEAIKDLIEKHRANVEARGCLGHTPLLLAAELFHDDAALMLLGDNANPAAATDEGKTALLLGVRPGGVDGNPLAAALLKDPRTDVNAHDGDGMTALKLAVKQGNPDTVAFFLQAPGIDVNERSGGVTALFLAKLANKPAIVDLLVNAGAKE